MSVFFFFFFFSFAFEGHTLIYCADEIMLLIKDIMIMWWFRN